MDLKQNFFFIEAEVWTKKFKSILVHRNNDMF